MSNALQRVVGLVIAIIGAGMLAYLDKALYTPSDRWVDVMVAINMPMMMLLTLIAACLVALGLWIMLRRGRPDAQA